MSHRKQVVQRRRRRRLARLSRRTRRGVLLLVVLSMLVLFLMIGTAFLITAKQAGKAAKASAKGSANASAQADQTTLLDEVVHQVLRGTTNEQSVLSAHSLLEDMYGLDGFTSVIPPANFVVQDELDKLPLLPNQPSSLSRVIAPYEQPAVGPLKQREYSIRWPDNGVDPAVAVPVPDVTGGQILEIDLVAFKNLLGVSETAAARTLSDNAYAGQVLTFVSGRAKGVSTRIVGSRHHGNWITLQLMAFPLADGSPLPGYVESGNSNQGVQNVLQGSKVLVNGRPFNGTGFGYDPDPSLATDSARLQMRAIVDPNLTNQPPLALLPNPAFFNPNRLQFGSSIDTAIQGTWQAYFGGHAIPQTKDVGLLDNPNYTTQFLRPFAGVFGADESYDAPDYQNMALALLPTDGKQYGLIESVPFFDKQGDLLIQPPLALAVKSANGVFQYVPLPSYHRPALLNFWANNANLAPDGLALNPLLLRHVSLRPNWFDHPKFSGSNADLASAMQNWSDIIAPLNPDGTRKTPPALTSLRSDKDAQNAANYLLGYSIYGPWDVDNDGDGVRDSIWIDFGAPTLTDAKGRRVKPLAAVLTIDMDGRVNVNTAGSLDLANEVPRAAVASNTNTMMLAPTMDPNTNLPLRISIAETPRGLGWGPADVNLLPVLGVDTDPTMTAAQRYDELFARYRRLLTGNDVYPGRYGGVPLSSGSATARTEARPGRMGYDTMAVIDRFETPDVATEFSAFAEPPDLSCRYGAGVNALGQSEFEAAAFNELSRTSFTLNGDVPYELDLSRQGSRGNSEVANDQPFGMAELERVLRVFDADASELPERLAALARLQIDPTLRMRITTDSNDLPTPNVQMPPFMGKMLSNPMQRPSTFAELLEARVRFAMRKPNVDAVKNNLNLNDSNNVNKPEYTLFPETVGTPGSDPRQKIAGNSPANSTIDPYDGNSTPAEIVRAIVSDLLATELAAGLCLDINRPFGNGRDDNDNGVVDEPGEDLPANSVAMWRNQMQRAYAAMTAQSLPLAVPAQFATAIFTPLNANPHFRDNSGNIQADQQETIDATPAPWSDAMLQRQLMARHLYVLALTLTANAEFGLGSPMPDDPMPVEQLALAERLAQWAVNAVDFRDADNIMTPFEYDANPFDGWDVDGNLATVVNVNGQDKWQTDVYGDDGKFGGEKENKKNADRGGVVWGCERPEVLITETLAMHDRRTTEETDDQQFPEPPGRSRDQAQTRNNTTPDADYDQSDRPRGALFIELYNPWGQTPGVNADTHARITDPNQPPLDAGVDIAAYSEQPRPDTGLRSPVWRFLIFKRAIPGAQNPQTKTPSTFSSSALEMEQWDPDSQNPELFPPNPPLVPANKPDSRAPRNADRSIYLAGYDPMFPDDGVAYFNFTGSPPGATDPLRQAYRPDNSTTNGGAAHPVRRNFVQPVRPGRYLVVGSGNDYDRDGVYETAICHRPPREGNEGEISPEEKRRLEFAKNRLSEATRRFDLDVRQSIPNNRPRVRMCDANGNSIMDPDAQFAVEGPAEVTGGAPLPGHLRDAQSFADVAIIDQVLDLEEDKVYYGSPNAVTRKFDLVPYDNRFDNSYASVPDPANPGKFLRAGIKRRRLTLSEPASGYIHDFKGSQWWEDEQKYAASGDKTGPALDKGTPLPIDIPLDGPIIADFASLLARSIGELEVDTPQDERTKVADFNSVYFDVWREFLELFPEQWIDPALVKVDAYDKNTEDPRVSYAVIYLQRLANPLWAWNPQPGREGHNPDLAVNPYRTVDSSFANLSVYNSRMDSEENGEGTSSTAGQFFASCERGQAAVEGAQALQDQKVGNAANAASPSIWQQQRATPEKLGNLSSNQNPYSSKDPSQRPLPQARNRFYSAAGVQGGSRLTMQDKDYPFNFKAMPYCSLGFLNRPFQESPNSPQSSAQGAYDRRAVPKRPFQWMAWNNRPYVSGNELMMVPRTRSSQLLRQPTRSFPVPVPVPNTLPNPLPVPDALVNPYDKVIATDKKDQATDKTPPPFPYVENFLYAPTGSTTPPKATPVHLYRVLDYVTTPSLFAGTHDWLNPAAFTATNADLGGRLDPRFNRMSPFNKVAEYREPGRINLNTIADQDVYRAIFHASGTDIANNGPQRARVEDDSSNRQVHPAPQWNQMEVWWGPRQPQETKARLKSFIDTRRGGRDLVNDVFMAGQPMFLLDPSSPTFLANPFRSSIAGDLVPLPNLRSADIDATLLRSDKSQPVIDQINETLVDTPMFTSLSEQSHNQFENNMAHWLQPVTRLANLTTTRSNVYATWVTIGFFEVEEAPELDDFAELNGISGWTQNAKISLYNRVYPDGYTLGQEAGSDTGDMQRLRGFYLLDRTIPVGFQLGVDHNVDEAIRLRRRID